MLARSLFLVFLGLLVATSLPSKRAEGAFASASTQAEFNIAYADYVSCFRNNTPTQCWNLHLDPYAVGDAIVSVTFETDAVATGPESIEIIGLNEYEASFDAMNIEDLGNNLSDLHSILVTHPGIPPDGNIDILDLSFEVNPEFTRDSATFIIEVSEVTTVDTDTSSPTFGDRSFAELVVQPAPVTISVPEPSTFTMLAALMFGVLPLIRRFSQ